MMGLALTKLCAGVLCLAFGEDVVEDVEASGTFTRSNKAPTIKRPFQAFMLHLRTFSLCLNGTIVWLRHYQNVSARM